jgi:hypothetical protein
LPSTSPISISGPREARDPVDNDKTIIYPIRVYGKDIFGLSSAGRWS